MAIFGDASLIISIVASEVNLEASLFVNASPQPPN